MDFLAAKYKTKIRRTKIRQPKTKNPLAHDPPKSTSQAQKSAAKPTNESACQNSRYTPGFFDCEGLLLEASSEHGFYDALWLPSGHGRGSHAEMLLQSLSCSWWEGQGLLRTLPDKIFSEKRSFDKKGPKITEKIRHATLPTLAAQQISIASNCSLSPSLYLSLYLWTFPAIWPLRWKFVAIGIFVRSALDTPSWKTPP